MMSADDPHATREGAAPPSAQSAAAPVDSSGTIPETRSDNGTAVFTGGARLPGDRSPASVPGHEILGELGRGGMGVVYKARQIGLNRTVALKMILSGSHAGSHELARFKTEAASIARLQHPNIVQIHEIGEHGGLPYFALEFCAGGSLARKLDGHPLPADQAAQVVETLARAMAAAHRAAIIHRDLKPANVLLTADGIPKIADFGLAKRLDEAGLTGSGAVMGTPSYMAPEQARGEVRTLGPAADIYALGAILYECLSGKAPFKGDSAFATITQVIFDEPARPSTLGRTLPHDLETICLKCLQKDPARRYLSADELADDLARFRAGEPIKARPVGRLERAWRRVKRNPVLSGVVAAAAGLMALVVVLILRGDPLAPVPAPVAPAGPQQDELLHIVAELNRSEPVWRLEHLEAKRSPVPRERNSADRIAAAARLLPAGWAKQYQLRQLALQPRQPDMPASAAQLAAVSALRPGTSKALAEARTLAEFPEGRHPINYARDGLSTMLPHATETTRVLELLWFDILSRSLEGRAAEALAGCQAALNASRSLRDEPNTVAQMVRLAGVLGTLQRVEGVLAQGARPDAVLTEADLTALQGLLEREAQEPVFLIMARAERGMGHWLMSAVTSGDFDTGDLKALQQSEPGLVKALESMPKGLAARQAHAWLLRHVTRWVDIAKLADHEQAAAMQEWHQTALSAPNGGRQFLPAALKLHENCLRHRATTRCAVVALAAERYRMQHERWPEKLIDLSPQHLKEVPTDPYDGQPLRFRAVPDGVVVYAVGPDGKDNYATLDLAKPGRDGSDIGLRLWDADKRPPAIAGTTS